MWVRCVLINASELQITMADRAGTNPGLFFIPGIFLINCLRTIETLDPVKIPQGLLSGRGGARTPDLTDVNRAL